MKKALHIVIAAVFLQKTVGEVQRIVQVKFTGTLLSANGRLSVKGKKKKMKKKKKKTNSTS